MNIILSNANLSASINPKGAELVSLKDNKGTEYMWEGNPEFWGKHSPVLFPIVGTLKDNSYTYNDKSYTLSRHGFARDMVFTVKEQLDDSATFSLVANAETKEKYPFDFELQLKYTLIANRLHIDYIVNNNGSEVMPFSIGAHPAFALQGNFEEYSLQFEKDEQLVSTQLQNDLLSATEVPVALHDEKLPLQYDLFENDALVFKKIESKYININKNNTPFLRVSFPDFPHLGLWTKPNAPFLCIEPWQGYADSTTSNGNLYKKEGVIVLEKSTKIKKGFSIEIL
ncbi:aldose 1-epimerase family protein [Flavobacterium arcticum]|uniref:Aldose 1-epimerase family protein n=1 Tax=Flavobacterium arcticum TaxID=1784713 RepID=A0A345HCN9_9FLAO|nr:aldose 1-epimerase family protein [Flavobacterium arcticum]AXG74349.1 aldose 1-epimerase family protein [Flavobacterium arcticum]KAF2507536.1 aldose 1-epimerase family protein [Flavobacterium arcticum]